MYSQYKVDVPEGRIGKWRVERFTVPEHDPLAIRYALSGRAVDPGTYTRLICDGAWDPLMSDTASEIRDHFPAFAEIRGRGGRILINGLGLGVVLKAALAVPTVTHVDVVEINPDVISLVWPTYYTDPRAQVHQADAYQIEWPKDARWNVAWHDIWPNLCTDNLPLMTKLHRKYARKVDWQGSWGREWLRSQRRRDQRWGVD